MYLYKKCTVKLSSFLVNDTTFASIILYVPKEYFRKNIEINMTINDKIRDEKLQYDINKESAN